MKEKRSLNSVVGPLIQADRIRMGYSRDTLAEYMNTTPEGVRPIFRRKPRIASAAFITNVESGQMKKPLAKEILLWFADALEVPPERYLNCAKHGFKNMVGLQKILKRTRTKIRWVQVHFMDCRQKGLSGYLLVLPNNGDIDIGVFGPEQGTIVASIDSCQIWFIGELSEKQLQLLSGFIEDVRSLPGFYADFTSPECLVSGEVVHEWSDISEPLTCLKQKK